jgi:hypothetical protein
MDSGQAASEFMLRVLAMDDADNIEECTPLAILGSVAHGVYHRRLELNERRRARRRYLRRHALLPNPGELSSFQQLRRSRDDQGYMTTMSVNMATFEYLLDAGFAHAWNTSTIPREDVNQVGEPRQGRRSLQADGALGLALHYLSSSMFETGLQYIFALTPATCSRYLDHALDILRDLLRTIPEGEIRWWDEEEMKEDEKLITAKYHRLKGAFGSMDGLSLPAASSSDPGVENSHYNRWKAKHRVVNILAFSPKGACVSHCIWVSANISH